MVRLDHKQILKHIWSQGENELTQSIPFVGSISVCLPVAHRRTRLATAPLCGAVAATVACSSALGVQVVKHCKDESSLPQRHCPNGQKFQHEYLYHSFQHDLSLNIINLVWESYRQAGCSWSWSAWSQHQEAQRLSDQEQPIHRLCWPSQSNHNDKHLICPVNYFICMTRHLASHTRTGSRLLLSTSEHDWPQLLQTYSLKLSSNPNRKLG